MSRWGKEKTFLFVSYYRSYECLWNTHSPLYKNNIARNNAYEALLKDMNDSSLTIKMIKTKIKNLRSVYHAEVRKINSSKRSGAGAADVYKPPMSWFTEMESFMADTDDYRETIEFDSVIIPEMQSQVTEYTNPDESPKSPLIKDGGQSQTTNNEQHQSGRTCAPRSRKRCNDTSVDKALCQLKAISDANKASAEDEFDLFCRSLAVQLKKMPLQRALICQQKLQSVMVEERLQSIDLDSPLCESRKIEKELN